MKTTARFATLLLTCAPLLACAAAPKHTPLATLQQLFAVEGNSPYTSPYNGTVIFSAMTSKYASPNGHGYRNELKVASALRLTAAQTHEHFSGRVTPTLPNGAKTIIAQYHVDGLDTILKVYVQDTKDGTGTDGVDNNGVFDILARILGPGGKEVSEALGTVRSGESFNLDIRFDAGDAVVTVDTDDGAHYTAQTSVPADDRKIYFKFGDYLQALDPATGGHTSDPKKWDEYYRLHHIDSSRIKITQTTFERTGAQP